MQTGTPLPNPKEERYSELRAKLIPPRLACVQAGYPNAHNAARLENRRRIQNRIREHRYHDEIDIAWQRRLLREELTRVALFRLPDLFVEIEMKNDKGEVVDIKRVLRPLSEWSDEERAAIAELYEDKDGLDRVKPHSKLTAIDLLMKLDGLVDPDMVVNVNQSVGVQVNGNSARDRIAGRIEKLSGRTVGEPSPA
jgi:hypothetical protein